MIFLLPQEELVSNRKAFKRETGTIRFLFWIILLVTAWRMMNRQRCAHWVFFFFPSSGGIHGVNNVPGQIAIYQVGLNSGIGFRFLFKPRALMLKQKLQCFGHLMRSTDSLEKTLMLGKIEGRRKRGRQRMRHFLLGKKNYDQAR